LVLKEVKQMGGEPRFPNFVGWWLSVSPAYNLAAS
jgi:hypothetical protein